MLWLLPLMTKPDSWSGFVWLRTLLRPGWLPWQLQRGAAGRAGQLWRGSMLLEVGVTKALEGTLVVGPAGFDLDEK